MKDKNVSPEEYATILYSVGFIVSFIFIALFAGGSYAIMKIFNLHWYSGVALFLFCLVIWSRKKSAG